MRHNKTINHLGRKSAHRKAMLSNMSSSLIMHKRIKTTVAKAKALKKYVEPLITKAKEDTTHNRRVVFSYLEDKHAVSELFREIAVKVGDRPGGYTRILRTGARLGDNAEMCIIELVDYNEAMLEAKETKKKARRSRRSKSSTTKKADTPNVEANVEEKENTEKKEVEAKVEKEVSKEKEEQPKNEAPKEEDTSKKEENTKEDVSDK